MVDFFIAHNFHGEVKEERGRDEAGVAFSSFSLASPNVSATVAGLRSETGKLQAGMRDCKKATGTRAPDWGVGDMLLGGGLTTIEGNDCSIFRVHATNVQVDTKFAACDFNHDFLYETLKRYVLIQTLRKLAIDSES
ncbi:hypothetical protein D9619_008662 [Psilocybe cf. subviscida]|uniref:Uncharacterized protein n=1 Tax=Psilocybe cf. subviscida TaxID=2480587 RepID=A0A8H5F100_9AGAR|nr:hypothetical protein D9619_008662 [Psilocybe cf. subviscida]